VVGAWEDKTANEDDVTQGTADNKPTLQTNELNGEPTLRFDGSNDYLQGAFTTGGALTQPFTLLAVAELTSTGSVYRYITDGDDASNRMVSGQRDDGDWWIYPGSPALAGDPSDTNWNIWTVVYNGLSSQIWLNGVSEVSGEAGTDEADGLTVGGSYTGAASWWLGDIAEIIIYDSELNTADKNEVGNYMADRYNLSYSDIT